MMKYLCNKYLEMIYLGTIVKNYERHFSIFQTFIQEMIEKIPEICICIYEDNSNDQTPQLIEMLKNKYMKNIHIHSEKFDWVSFIKTWDGKPCRIECITRARNQLMELLESRGMGKNQDDVCIMIDTDFKNVPNTERISYWATHFPQDVDALFANGKDDQEYYYDIFAYRDQNFPFDYDLYGEKNHTQLQEMKTQICKQQISSRTERTSVFSAFAGIGIYRASSIKGVRYSFLPTKSLEMFYRSFIESCPQNYFSKLVKHVQTSNMYETHYHGSLLGSKWFGENGFFYYNSWGYNVPIVCEHVTFHIEMIQKGHHRLFIEPSLTYEWS